MSLLEIKNLHVSVDGNEILKGIDLTLNAGEVHSIMGPNGSGKSTLAQVLARRDAYEVTEGSILFEGKDLLEMKPEEAACEGVFLAFQYPVEIPGIGNTYFLRSALNAQRKYRGEDEMDAMDFLPMFREKLKLLEMDDKLMNRSLNEGFSGGEKKRNEILQMAVLEPKLAILDETDSGLDIDALRIVAGGVNSLRSPERAMLVVTHYQRLLNYIVPDFVHVLVDGRIVRSGGKELPSSWRSEATAGRNTSRPERGREGDGIGDCGGYRKLAGELARKFHGVCELAPGKNSPWLKRLREDAFSRFCDVGFPTTHDEDWRFTNVSAIARTEFRPATTTKLAPGDTTAWRVDDVAASLVFVNGRFDRELSKLEGLPRGVTVASLRDRIESHPEEVEKHLGRYADTQRDPFVALNTAFIGDGAYVHVARGVVVEAPIYLLYLSTKEDAATMTHPRNLIVAEDESQVAVIEDYASVGGECIAFSNAVTELIAGESTVAQHYLIEREHLKAFNVSTLRIQQGRSANAASHSLLLGGGPVRNNVHPVLAGEGGECLINGLFLGTGRQHLDNYMHVEHAAHIAAAGSFITASWMDKRTESFTGGSLSTRLRKRPMPSRRIETCC